MREIIQLQVGGCGNKIGAQFWKDISSEHGIDSRGAYHGTSDLQLERLNVYYTEGAGGRYFPRSILMDLDQCTVDSIVSGPFAQFYKPDNILTGRGGTGNNWAMGHYTEGALLMEEVIDVIRKEVEGCEQLQGFDIAHSIGGGTGGGMACLLISTLREEYTDRLIQGFTIFPSIKTPLSVLEPYNATLSIQILCDSTQAIHVIENESLDRICTKELKISQPSFDDFNTLVSSVMSGISCSIRFPGQLNSNLRKLLTNLTPFSRIHFFMTSFAPIVSPLAYQPLTEKELIRQLFEPGNIMSSSNPHYGRYYSATPIFRGKVSMNAVDSAIKQYKEKNFPYFREYIPCSVAPFSCDVPPKGGIEKTATLVANNSAIQETFKAIATNFREMYRRYAFLHWYTQQGMDEMEFREAETNLNDLVSRYQEYGTDASDDDHDDDEDDAD